MAQEQNFRSRSISTKKYTIQTYHISAGLSTNVWALPKEKPVPFAFALKSHEKNKNLSKQTFSVTKIEPEVKKAKKKPETVIQKNELVQTSSTIVCHDSKSTTYSIVRNTLKISYSPDSAVSKPLCASKETQKKTNKAIHGKREEIVYTALTAQAKKHNLWKNKKQYNKNEQIQAIDKLYPLKLSGISTNCTPKSSVSNNYNSECSNQIEVENWNHVNYLKSKENNIRRNSFLSRSGGQDSFKAFQFVTNANLYKLKAKPKLSCNISNCPFKENVILHNEKQLKKEVNIPLKSKESEENMLKGSRNNSIYLKAPSDNVEFTRRNTFSEDLQSHERVKCKRKCNKSDCPILLSGNRDKCSVDECNLMNREMQNKTDFSDRPFEYGDSNVKTSQRRISRTDSRMRSNVKKSCFKNTLSRSSKRLGERSRSRSGERSTGVMSHYPEHQEFERRNFLLKKIYQNLDEGDRKRENGDVNKRSNEDKSEIGSYSDYPQTDGSKSKNLEKCSEKNCLGYLDFERKNLEMKKSSLGKESEKLVKKHSYGLTDKSSKNKSNYMQYTNESSNDITKIYDPEAIEKLNDKIDKLEKTLQNLIEIQKQNVNDAQDNVKDVDQYFSTLRHYSDDTQELENKYKRSKMSKVKSFKKNRGWHLLYSNPHPLDSEPESVYKESPVKNQKNGGVVSLADSSSKGTFCCCCTKKKNKSLLHFTLNENNSKPNSLYKSNSRPNPYDDCRLIPSGFKSSLKGKHQAKCTCCKNKSAKFEGIDKKYLNEISASCAPKGEETNVDELKSNKKGVTTNDKSLAQVDQRFSPDDSSVKSKNSSKKKTKTLSKEEITNLQSNTLTICECKNEFSNKVLYPPELNYRKEEQNIKLDPKVEEDLRLIMSEMKHQKDDIGELKNMMNSCINMLKLNEKWKLKSPESRMSAAGDGSAVVSKELLMPVTEIKKQQETPQQKKKFHFCSMNFKKREKPDKEKKKEKAENKKEKKREKKKRKEKRKPLGKLRLFKRKKKDQNEQNLPPESDDSRRPTRSVSTITDPDQNNDTKNKRKKKNKPKKGGKCWFCCG